MIDTFQVGLKDYEIVDKRKLTMKSLTKLETGETETSYFYNDEVINLNIDNLGLSIKTNVSRLYGLGDNNFYPLGQESFIIAVKNLKDRVKNIGIIGDLDNAKVWRLDLFKNVITEKPFNAYRIVLEGLNLKRTLKREYPDGFLMRNGQRELIFYNKVRELKEKLTYAYIKEMGLETENIVRGETRFLKSREVKRQGIEVLGEIPDKWTDLKRVYLKHIQECFKYEFKGGEELNIETLKALINNAMFSLITEGEDAFKIYGLYPFSFVSRNELKNALLSKMSRAQTYRILTKIEDFKRHSLKNIEYKKLYDELKRKFLEE